ncbi:hypothetical protein M436DRAFT_60477 [Aureobasidium namibiae CBS 147.97]|uniref:PLD phosphodiesterase domain-containing protein n=1 Tax=Aureobasidium namibiae CBS 147.97 TaxID=1043004 RepID=A0A074WYW4_9PEZI
MSIPGHTSILQPWLSDLKAGFHRNITSSPNYFLHSPSSLITTSNLHSLHLGTGESIHTSLLPLLESANEELILVTCFWASSATQKLINEVLVKLSEKGRSRGRKLRVRICFSSSGVLQKVLHPQTLNGKIYPPESWQSTLSLPSREQLQGLDMQVKSIFLLPFSVMHPKFIIVDRKVAVLPSCNVSWEDWFEGAVTLTGPVVSCFVEFWREFWAQQEDRDELVNSSGDSSHEDLIARISQPQPQQGQLPLHHSLDSKDIPTIFLPSPHHRNPDFRLPWQESSAPPPTPLNTFFLRSLASAEREIYIQTPNTTAAPVLSAILSTLQRGIDIHIVTSEKLMILEQLVTAGTTTSACISKLISRYQTLRSTPSDLEAGRPKLGTLKIEYFFPGRGDKEPKQSHLKCTIVDGELVMLGSGNLDRASWYTSQELGVAFFDKVFATRLRGDLARVLEGRLRSVLHSGT